MDGIRENPISFSGQSSENAIIGISGERTNRFTHTQFHNIPPLRKGEPEGFVDLHPVDARQRNISEGDLLKIISPRGYVMMKATAIPLRICRKLLRVVEFDAVK